MKNLIGWGSLVVSILFSTVVYAESATIAVASNFTKTIEVIGQAFEKETGHQIRFSFGPTGKLYAQIKNGAPFDAFFGADERRPKKTIEDGLGVKQSYFVYAQGQIVLYSAKYPVDSQPIEVLRSADFKHLSIANPKTAPYGERAVAFLKKKGLYEHVKSRIVNGESIAHAFQYVATHNAPIGFVAMSQVVDPKSPVYQKGAYWVVPASDYAPINQGALVLKRGENNVAVQAFMNFMKTQKAITIMNRYGYKVD
ncbi:molybdate ABC transporter substrate-binding protein [Hydrogenovibrio sp. 3SP14C1]|uniref:molybdate ABC transporter substrate-binding protein n=1 Tax=Hydrogenovibrio sp. 3SP14C1 TaxID=3038774 RepID=UPI0024162381|nr:molybdate ABC transporter substrate-binding protein [Hydrogenovibrio sp. 3SP14C1]MDG4812577.1 molybdate ABC transporter substrate-binding protein [Hydrogenovibrio sp. 3SP14C1]